MRITNVGRPSPPEEIACVKPQGLGSPAHPVTPSWAGLPGEEKLSKGEEANKGWRIKGSGGSQEDSILAALHLEARAQLVLMNDPAQRHAATLHFRCQLEGATACPDLGFNITSGCVCERISRIN